VPKSNNSQNHWENNTETQIPGIADQIIRLPNTRMRYNNVCNQNNSKKCNKHTRNKIIPSRNPIILKITGKTTQKGTYQASLIKSSNSIAKYIIVPQQDRRKSHAAMARNLQHRMLAITSVNRYRPGCSVLWLGTLPKTAPDVSAGSHFEFFLSLIEIFQLPNSVCAGASSKNW
jgi:hypothetical protein